jgi:hypothetical protein
MLTGYGNSGLGCSAACPPSATRVAVSLLRRNVSPRSGQWED